MYIHKNIIEFNKLALLKLSRFIVNYSFMHSEMNRLGIKNPWRSLQANPVALSLGIVQ